VRPLNLSADQHADPATASPAHEPTEAPRSRADSWQVRPEVWPGANQPAMRGEGVTSVQYPTDRGRVRLLIVDDVPDTAQNVQKLLYFERDIQVVGVAGSAREAIAKAAKLQPDITLMDINMPDMDGLRATEMILRQVPTRVVMMSVQGEPEYLHRAMMAGARGYLIKPFSSEDLVSTLRAAAQVPVLVSGALQLPATARESGRLVPIGRDSGALRRIVAVYSPKGGVGRSVVACNLAVALKKVSGARVALVDADLQSGDAHVLLNMNTPNTIDDLREAGSLDAEIISGAVAVHDSGIELLRAPIALESAELFSADAMKAILVELREHFDYLIMDTDDTFSEATLTVLDMADQILLVTTLEVTTINKISRFFEVIDRLGYPESKVHLICNRVDPYFGIKPAQVEVQVRHRFIAQIPEDNHLVVTSVNRGIPFVLTDKRASVSRSIVALAERVVQLEQAPDHGSSRTGGAYRRPF
jgi:pilus assembly protein CpaE